MESPSVTLFLVAAGILEGIFIALFLQTTSGAVPFFSLMTGRIVPQAFYTGLLGLGVLHMVKKKKVFAVIKRLDIKKEL